jgi:hypothetical protein
MIDTVPRSVQLSEPVVPLAVKPYSLSLTLDYEGQLRLAGYIRIFDSSSDGLAWNPPAMPVDLTWTPSTGACSGNCTVRAPFMGLYSTSFWGNVALFRFNQTINPSSSISSFVIDWARSANTNAMTHADNGGAGFPVQDVMLLQPSSCKSFSTSGATVKLVVAIRNGVNPPTAAYVNYNFRQDQPGSLVPRWETARAQLKRTGPSSSPLYTLYDASFDVPDSTGTTMDLVVTTNGQTFSEQGKKVAFLSC